MSEYTSSKDGFQQAMQKSLNGPSTEEAVRTYVDSTTTPGFYQVLNGVRHDREEYIKHITGMRAAVSGFHPTVHQFLRDGTQLAVRMTGSVTTAEGMTPFESAVFAQVDDGSGKMEWLIECAAAGSVEQAAT